MQSKIMADFQRHLASKETDKEKKAKIILKATQIEDNIKFNSEFIEYLNK
jgi:hypothetical protein